MDRFAKRITLWLSASGAETRGGAVEGGKGDRLERTRAGTGQIGIRRVAGSDPSVFDAPVGGTLASIAAVSAVAGGLRPNSDTAAMSLRVRNFLW